MLSAVADRAVADRLALIAGGGPGRGVLALPLPPRRLPCRASSARLVVPALDAVEQPAVPVHDL